MFSTIALFIAVPVSKLFLSIIYFNYFSANFDALTGIANRANIMKQLIETKELCDRNKQKFALIIFDLDKFKRINDEYGHLVGDEALKYTAQTV